MIIVYTFAVIGCISTARWCWRNRNAGSSFGALMKTRIGGSGGSSSAKNGE